MSDVNALRSHAVSSAEFRALFDRVQTWGRWGRADQRGALNRLSAKGVRSAARLVRSGAVVSLGLPLNTSGGPDCPSPAEFRITQDHSTAVDSAPMAFAKDFIGADYHSDGHSHIDALCHVSYRGRLYNDVPASSVEREGASVEGIEAAAGGLVGRGVLLDIPQLRGVPWLEPGEHVFAEDFERAQREQAVTVGEGDTVLVRTGHTRCLRERGAWETASLKAGLHPTAMPLLADAGVLALGCDGNSDTAPSSTEDVPFPIHVLALNAMGILLLDYLQLEGLAQACASARRWEFMCLTAPLRVTGGTGSPVNPLAIL
jgi:kynurenine formamidase